MADETFVKVEGLNKTYEAGSEKVHALQDVSFEIKKSQYLAVLGPSGSGKTTLLTLLGGLDRPTTGRIFLDGVEISNLEEGRLSQIRRRQIGFVFQNYNLVDELTVLENVGLPLLFEGESWKKMQGRVLELLGEVGLSGKERRRPSQLSAGEQQRAAVARALANNPSLVLMDEPTGNLDEANSHALMGLVGKLNRESGITFVIATHNPEMAKSASSRILLRSGRIMLS